jgi:GNAT superfamily N-acetyltransferase
VTVTVDLAGPEDVEAAVAVFTAGEGARRGTPVPVEVQEAVAARLRDGGGWLLAAREHATVVGVAAGFDARADDGAGDVLPGLAHLSLVFVEPARWGRGIGGRLVDAVLAEARRRANDRIQLWTHEDTARAPGPWTRNL